MPINTAVRIRHFLFALLVSLACAIALRLASLLASASLEQVYSMSGLSMLSQMFATLDVFLVFAIMISLPPVNLALKFMGNKVHNDAHKLFLWA